MSDLVDNRNVHPKLQLLLASNVAESASRAVSTPSLAVRPPDGEDLFLWPDKRVSDARLDPSLVSRLPDSPFRPLPSEPLPLGPDDEVTADDVYASVFVQLRDDWAEDDDSILEGVTYTRSDLRTLEVTRTQLAEIAANPKVMLLELAEGLKAPRPTLGTSTGAAPAARWAPEPSTAAALDVAQGTVLVGIIDVGGFDFAHEDFLDEDGNTRFVKIWDQGGSLRKSPQDPRDPNIELFDYGSEIDQTHMNAAIAASSALGVAAWELEPQSVMRRESHATHVASIAAGNSGVCPGALLAGVLVNIDDITSRRQSFYDTSRIVHAVEYLTALAEKLKATLSINISLGTNGHAHDASSAGSRWLDALLSTPGRAVCVAAGNAGQERATSAEDWGWIMGRIHTSGRIAGPDLTWDIEWLVFGDGLEDLSDNELELWYGAQDRFEVRIRTPDGTWLPWVGPGEYFERREVVFGDPDPDTGERRRCFVSVHSRTYYPANGANYIAVYLIPEYDPDKPSAPLSGVQAGQWTVRLRGRRIRDGRFDGWIERDDPIDLGSRGRRRFWSFPSFFSARSNVDRSSVSSLACGHQVVSVANLDPVAEQIHITSSQGPTRDGRAKPEVAAIGTRVVAARGFCEPDEAQWVEMTGTSMASPFVCGVVADMFRVQPSLTAAQIGAIIQATARPLPGADYAWRDDAGFGVIDPEGCIAEALVVNDTKEV